MQPECGACRRHQVPCHYEATQRNTARRQSPRPAAAVDSGALQGCRSGLQTEISPPAKRPDQETRELMLLHYFVTETISAFHDPIGIWKTQIPLVGLKYRFVFDALLSLAALDLYRHTYGPLQNTRAGSDATNKENRVRSPLSVANGHEHYLCGRDPEEMQRISHVYLESAIEGQQKALENLDNDHFEPGFLASMVIYMIGLYSLACPREDGDGHDDVAPDERLWFSLGRGCQEIARSWSQSINAHVLKAAGFFDTGPDFSNEEELFHVKHRDVFGGLLACGFDFEVMSPEEQEAYEQAVSFLGLIYKGVRDNSAPAYVSGSYLASFAAKVPPPFSRLVLERRPRASAIVAHLFAIMRLVEAQLPQYQGIAALQIPAICERMPRGWKKVMEWPSSVAAQDMDTLSLPSPPSSSEDLQQTQTFNRTPSS